MVEIDVKNNCDNQKYNNVDIKTITARDIGTDYSFKRKFYWPNVAGFIFLHTMAIIGLIYLLTGLPKWQTYLWTTFLLLVTTEGVTIGAHRLFAHKSFIAHPILKAILIIAQTLAGQNCVYIWVRDHRLHHRYTDTDGDPHNSKRGFFFSHMGWLMIKKHPLIKELGKNIDMSDLEADSMVMFQKNHYKKLYFLFAIFIPIFIPVYYFGESWTISILVTYFFRYTIQLNGTWLVNSAAHLYGTRPYDRNLQPVENWFVSFISLGEGWHNYHHAFPWDYKAAELTMHYNASASFIRFFEKIGLASDLKTASPEMVRNRIVKLGDGTHFKLGNDEARAAVKVSIGPLHPLNPSYNSTLEVPNGILKLHGLPLFHENDIIKNVELGPRKRHIAS